MLLTTGMIFSAEDKLGRTYIYKFLGIKLNDATSCSYIHLRNETLNMYTDVEYAWFGEHRIEMC